MGLFVFKLSVNPFAPSGSTPMILHLGNFCFTKEPIPPINPPPPTEIIILSIFCIWLQISNPKVAVPCMVKAPSKGCIKE